MVISMILGPRGRSLDWGRDLIKYPFVCLLVASSLVGQVKQAPALLVDHSDGGPVVTELGYGIAVNKGSTLHRDWISVNDPSCPVQILLGVQPNYVKSKSGYQFVLKGDGKPSQPITAVRVISVLFDVWGNHMQNLADTEISDKPADAFFSLPGTWYASENDVSEFLTSVTYVRYVRTADGKIWSANLAAISKKLAEIQFKISELNLESSQPEKTGGKP